MVSRILILAIKLSLNLKLKISTRPSNKACYESLGSKRCRKSRRRANRVAFRIELTPLIVKKFLKRF